jgi:hypothetical protein
MLDAPFDLLKMLLTRAKKIGIPFPRHPDPLNFYSPT